MTRNLGFRWLWADPSSYPTDGSELGVWYKVQEFRVYASDSPQEGMAGIGATRDLMLMRGTWQWSGHALESA